MRVTKSSTSGQTFLTRCTCLLSAVCCVLSAFCCLLLYCLLS
jgi:hypothetical protein